MSNTRYRFSLSPIEKDTRIRVWGILSRILRRDKLASNMRCRVVYSRKKDEVYVFNIVALRELTYLAQRHMRNGLKQFTCKPDSNGNR